MTVRKLLKGLLDTDLYDLYVWSLWYFKPGRPSCIECIKTRKDVSGNPPDCHACGNPMITAMNKHFKGDKSNGKKI